MSEANKTTLLRANEAIARLDFEGFLAHCTEDTDWTFVGEQTLKGKDAIRRWMRETYQRPPVVTVDSLIAEGDDLVAVGEITVHTPGGDGKRQGYCDVWRLAGGKLKSLRAYVVALE